MPGPILDVGFDVALARGMGLGMEAARLREASLYHQDEMAHRLAQEEAARDRLEQTALYQSRRADIAQQSADLREHEAERKLNDQTKQRAARHEQAARLYDLEQGGPPEPEMGPFQEGQVPQDQLYQQDRETFATGFEDAPVAALMEQAKAARSAARVRQIDRSIQALEEMDPKDYPGGADAHARHHEALWMERDGLKGSVSAILGPAGWQERLAAQGNRFDKTLAQRQLEEANRNARAAAGLADKQAARSAQGQKPSQSERALRMLSDAQLNQLMTQMAAPENAWNFDAMKWAQFYAEQQRREQQPQGAAPPPQIMQPSQPPAAPGVSAASVFPPATVQRPPAAPAQAAPIDDAALMDEVERLIPADTDPTGERRAAEFRRRKGG